MSLTKRYLESLPAGEQDAILGGVDNAYISPDEWTRDAENEPAELWGCGGCGAMWPLSHLRERGCPDCHADREWARALMEEEEEPRMCDCDCHRADGGGLVCSACTANHIDRFTERDEAPLVKRQPPGVKAGPMDV